MAVWCFSDNSFSTIQFSESPGCAVVSRDHAVCLAAEHAERRGLPRLHELGDADAEGADPFPVQIDNEFFRRPQHCSRLNLDLSATPRSEVILA